MAKNWLRRMEIIAGGKAFNSKDFDIDFSVSFNINEEPNDIDASIMNLSNTTINNNLIEKKPLIINAGYESDVGTIFLGYIADSETKWEGQDKKTSIIGLDATDAYMNLYISKSYKEGIFANEIIEDIIRMVGLRIGEFKLNNNVQYNRGRQVIGRARSILSEIVEVDCKTNLQIINGMVVIRSIGVGLQTGFILNKDTGLIGMPEPITGTDDTEKKSKLKANFKAKCLLNYRIAPLSTVQIQSNALNGMFVVVSGRHVGTKTSDYITEMELLML